MTIVDPCENKWGIAGAPLWPGSPPKEVMEELARMPKCMDSVSWIAQGRLHHLFCEQALNHLGPTHWGLWEAAPTKDGTKRMVKVEWSIFKEE